MNKLNFKKTLIKDVYIIKGLKKKDSRGYFSKNFSVSLLNQLNLNFSIKEINSSLNINKGTIRGLHYLDYYKKEFKLIHCIKGKIFDVFVDLRKSSKTFSKWKSKILHENTNDLILIPPGVAHGYQTLTKNTIVLYYTSSIYKKKYDKGINPFDKKISIKWPIKTTIISKRDKFLNFLD